MVFNGNLLNWNWGKKNLPIRREDSSPLEVPAYFPLQRDLNRVFDDFFRTFENAGLLSPLGEISESMFHPKLEMKENPDALS